jgi:two-component system NarL family sensor kinase
VSTTRRSPALEQFMVLEGPSGPAHGPVPRSHRVVALITLVLVALTAWGLFERITAPSDGTVVQLSNARWRGDRITINLSLEPTSDLRPRDVVTALDGVPLLDVPAGRVFGTGDEVTYTVLRDGRATDVTVRLHTFPLVSFLGLTWPTLLMPVTALGIAVFVFRRRPGDRAAQALMVLTGLMLSGTVGWLLGDEVHRLASSGPTVTDVAGEVALAMVWGAMAHFALVAPGSTLRVHRWWLVLAYGVPLLLHGAHMAVNLPVARSTAEARGIAGQVSLWPSAVLPVACAVLLVVSYRSTVDLQARVRMRWILVTFVLGGLAFVTLWIYPNTVGRPAAPETTIALVFLLPTLALGAAILRYRLFDIEVILRRSLLYGAVTGTVLLVYLTGAWLLSRVPGISRELVAVVTSGLVAFAAPALRTTLHRRVGRLVFGARDDPFVVVSRLGRIDAAAEPRQVLDDIAATLARTLRLSYVSIELRSERSRFTVRATHGTRVGPALRLPLGGAEAGSQGELVLAVNPGHEPFGPADRRLLDALARQVSAAAATVLLTNELQQSRERIVLAREDERRRLHHRLHDGLGPTLVAGVMQLEVAKAMVTRDPDAAARLLEVHITASRELVRDVRGLVFDLRPPALDQLGLAGALRARAAYLAPPEADGRPATHIEVIEPVPTGDLPAAVEVAAFWIGVEAISNAVRHGRARRCDVRLVRDRDLLLEVWDDGVGLPDPVHPGGGMISMRERAEELGGFCRVASAVGGGTVVAANLPLRHEGGEP